MRNFAKLPYLCQRSRNGKILCHRFFEKDPFLDGHWVESNEMKRILVTGASGFVGRPLCQSIQEKGIRVIALNRSTHSGPWDDEIVADITELTFNTRLEQCDAAIHLAGITHSDDIDRYECERINVTGTIQLVESVIAAGIKRFIFVSSAKAIRFAETVMLKEDSYGQSKYHAELELHRLAESAKIELTIIRPALIYGVGVKGNLDRMIKAIYRGWLPPLPETDHGISMISVNDVVEAINTILSNEVTISQTYTLMDNQVYSARRIYNEITAGFDRKLPKWYLPMPLIQSAAFMGDLIGKLFNTRLPINKEVVDKLFADFHYPSNEITQDTGWQPTQVLADVLPSIISQYLESAHKL